MERHEFDRECLLLLEARVRATRRGGVEWHAREETEEATHLRSLRFQKQKGNILKIAALALASAARAAVFDGALHVLFK